MTAAWPVAAGFELEVGAGQATKSNLICSSRAKMFVIAEFVTDMNSSDETISTTTSTVCSQAKQFET